MTTQNVLFQNRNEETATAAPPNEAPPPKAPRPGRKTSGPPNDPPRRLLTTLDRETCHLLAKLAYLRTDQLVEARRQLAQRLGLPVAQKEQAAMRGVQRRARQLVEAHILRRIPQPVFPGEGRKQYVYALDQIGAHLVSEQTGIPLSELDGKPKEAERNLLFLDHSLAIGDYYLALTRACLTHHVTLAEWSADRTLKRHPARVTVTLESGATETVPLIPDACYKLVLPSHQSTCLFLEMDLATMVIEPARAQLRAWRRKFLAYRFLPENGVLANHYGADSMIVTVVTTAPARADHLRTACERAGGDRRFWFTTFADLKNGDVLRGKLWRVATKGATRYALLPPAA